MISEVQTTFSAAEPSAEESVGIILFIAVFLESVIRQARALGIVVQPYERLIAWAFILIGNHGPRAPCRADASDRGKWIPGLVRYLDATDSMESKRNRSRSLSVMAKN